jgi:hypothetical protein
MARSGGAFRLHVILTCLDGFWIVLKKADVEGSHNLLSS